MVYFMNSFLKVIFFSPNILKNAAKYLMVVGSSLSLPWSAPGQEEQT